jgi:rhodanese-related sulfurtransferase
MQKRITAITCMFFIALLFSSILVIRPTAANELGYQNISVRYAKHLIQRNPNVIILDVRNQSEYDLGHLYDAVLMPVYTVENNTVPIDLPQPPANDSVMMDVYERANSGFKLSEHVNDPVIVYCAAGSRSAQASQILAENGFTRVYNMLGGITAWMQADYQIYTSNHYVTVDFANHGRRTLIDIEPMLLHPTDGNSCSNCSTQNPSDMLTSENITSYEILEDTEEKSSFRFTFEYNGTASTITINRTQLWLHADSHGGCNRTVTFESIDVTVSTEGVSEIAVFQSFTLTYRVRSADFNVALRTDIQNASAGSYATAYTVFGYAPTTDKADVLSTEAVEFKSSVKLSDHYLALSKVSRKLGRIYQTSKDEDLTKLAIGYNIMQNEARQLYRIVKRNLSSYDKPILNSSATLLDSYCTDLCGSYCGIGAGIVCGSVCAAVALGCGPGYVPCLLACLSGCGALSGGLCTWLCYELCGEEATVETYGCAIVCGAICGGCKEAGMGYFCWVCTDFCKDICHYLWPDEPDPEPDPIADYWATSISWTETYGSAVIYNPSNLLGSFPDGADAELGALYQGDMARIISVTSAQATGEILLYGRTAYGTYSRLVVYVSSDNSNWDFVSDQYVDNTDDEWISCGYASNFNYVMVIAYSDYYPYTYCDLLVDCVCVVYSDPPAYERYWATSISWTEEYGAGSAVNYEWNLLGENPNSNYAQLYAPNYGCMARISAELNYLAVGDISIYAYSTSGYNSHLYVYVSPDDSNWEFVHDLTIDSSTPSWINIDVYPDAFKYILLIGYDTGNSVNLHIDTVRVEP